MTGTISADCRLWYRNFTLYRPPNNATRPILKDDNELTYHFVIRETATWIAHTPR